MLKIVEWAIEKIRPYPKNARVHSDEQVSHIAASIAEFGFVNPILVDANGECIAGHGRLEAMKKLGKKVVPVIQLGHLTAEQAQAYRIADNQIPLGATWDDTVLRLELTQLRTMDFPLQALGWTAPTLDAYLGAGRLKEDPERVPDPPAKPMVKRGDLWILGNHRLMCGDAASKSDVAALLAGAKPHLMVTDPPYGVNYDPEWRNDQVAAGKSASKWSGRGRALGLVTNDDRADWREAYALFSGDVAYVWCASMTNDVVVAGLESSGLMRRAQIVWGKNHIAIGRGDYHWQHEVCWYVVRKGKPGQWSGDRKQSTLWAIDKPQASETGHSTQKPVECMRRPIVNNSKPGDSVYDPFSGSFTTGMACEASGRRALCLEIEPAYVEMSILRWQGATGQEAVLSGTGQTFAAVAAERAKKRKPNEARHPGKPVSRKRPVAAEPDPAVGERPLRAGRAPGLPAEG